MWECMKPPNEWQYHPWAAHPLACRLPLILLVPMTWERKKWRMLNKGVARPHAGQWQGLPPPDAPALLVDRLTVKPQDECECQELWKMYVTWSLQPTGWIWTGQRSQLYKKEWGVPWPVQPRDYTASPLAVRRKCWLVWRGTQCSGTECHVPSTITCPQLDIDDYSWRPWRLGHGPSCWHSWPLCPTSLVYIWYVLLFQHPRDLISQSLRLAMVAVVAPPICKLCPL